MKPAGQPEQAGRGKYLKSRVLRMLVRKFLYNVNDARALLYIYVFRVFLRLTVLC